MVERQVKIEVGYGLEKIVTDEFARATITEMTPYFRRKEYGPGLLTGAVKLANKVAESRGAPRRW